jgi:hypothetical protein
MKLTIIFLAWAGSGLLIAGSFSLLRAYQKRKQKQFFHGYDGVYEFEDVSRSKGNGFPSRLKEWKYFEKMEDQL